MKSQHWCCFNFGDDVDPAPHRITSAIQANNLSGSSNESSVGSPLSFVDNFESPVEGGDTPVDTLQLLLEESQLLTSLRGSIRTIVLVTQGVSILACQVIMQCCHCELCFSAAMAAFSVNRASPLQPATLTIWGDAISYCTMTLRVPCRPSLQGQLLHM